MGMFPWEHSQKVFFMATILDVAKLAGVSKTTVSRVINGQGPVKESTKNKIITAAKALNYEPNYFAQGMRTSKTNVIGILIPSYSNPFYPELLEGIEEVSLKYGYIDTVCSTYEDAEREYQYIKHLVNRRVDGLIICTWCMTERNLRFLKEIGREIPIVFMDYFLKSEQISCVIADGYTSSRFASEYLIDQGRNKIAYIKNPPTFPAAYERFLGYRDALESKGLSVNEAYIYEGNFHMDSGFNAAAYFMNLPTPPDAIMAAADIMAVGALHCLARLEIDVPKDVQVIGFDNIQLSRLVNPQLTTIAQPILDLGRTAAHTIIQKIASKDLSQTQRILGSSLILRGSTGSPNGKEYVIPIPALNKRKRKGEVQYAGKNRFLL